jgi:hypothetical protein
MIEDSYFFSGLVLLVAQFVLISLAMHRCEDVAEVRPCAI